MRERIGMLDTISSHIGKYYSDKWVRSNILNQSDADVERMDSEIAEEKPEDDTSGSTDDIVSDTVDDTEFTNNESNLHIDNTHKEEIHEAQLKMIESMTKILEE